MIKIELSRVDDDYNLEAVNDTGNTILFDGAPEIGGHGRGMRPCRRCLPRWEVAAPLTSSVFCESNAKN